MYESVHVSTRLPPYSHYLKDVSQNIKIQMMWMMDVLTNCGNHFTIHTYIKSLCCVPYTYAILYVNGISVKLREMERNKLVAV